MPGPLKHRITAFGRTMSLKEWARDSGQTVGCLRHRLLVLGWEPERALTMPPMTRSEVARNAGMAWAEMCGPSNVVPALARQEMWPGARDAPYQDDPIAQIMVGRHGWFTLDEIGLMMGIGRERVRQIEAAALEKFAHNARRMGLDLQGMLAELDRGEDVYPDWDIAEVA